VKSVNHYCTMWWGVGKMRLVRLRLVRLGRRVFCV